MTPWYPRGIVWSVKHRYAMTPTDGPTFDRSGKCAVTLANYVTRALCELAHRLGEK